MWSSVPQRKDHSCDGGEMVALGNFQILSIQMQLAESVTKLRTDCTDAQRAWAWLAEAKSIDQLTIGVG